MGRGDKIAPSKRKKKPTAAQAAARLRNLPQNKENIAPSPPPAPPHPKPVALPKDWKHAYQKLLRRYRHSKSRQKKLEAELATFKLTDAATKHTAELSRKRMAELSNVIGKLVAEGHKKSAASDTTIQTLRKDIKALKQRVRRSIRGLARSVDQAKKKWSLCRLKEKGIYTVHARKLARVMADSGCARGKVGPLLERIGQIFGIQVVGSMDRRTVGRAIEEGGVAARMQAIYELSRSEGVYNHLRKNKMLTSCRSNNQRGQHIKPRDKHRVFTHELARPGLQVG
jgi:hypothetical protein